MGPKNFFVTLKSPGKMRETKLLRHIILKIDLLAILQKSLDRAIFLNNFIREVR